MPWLEGDQHEGGVRRAENLHLGKVASQDWNDALRRRGMQMCIDFVNDHDARLFGQKGLLPPNLTTCSRLMAREV